jgi:outer membrane protein OmpA-like peptidoglycan-associated protein
MNRKIILAFACFTMASAKAGAQELNVWGNGGWQGLSYKVQNGQSSLLANGSLGVGYTFPVGRHWGLITGLTGGWYGSKATLKDGTYSYDEVDNTGSAFRYDIKTTGYQEKQQFFSFGIPLQLQYHTGGSHTQWYIDGGGKLLLPFNAQVRASAQQLVLSGYYPDFNVEVSNLPQHGFGTIGGWLGETTTKLKTQAVLNAETGLSFMLSPHTRLYAGLYLEYGLSDMRGSNSASSLVSYNPSGITGVQPGSVLNLPNAGAAKLFSYGLTVRLGFGHSKSRPSRTSSKPSVPPSPETRPETAAATAPASPAQVLPKPVQQEQPKPVQEEQPKEPQPAQTVEEPAQPAMRHEEIAVMQQPVVFGVLGKTDIPVTAKPHLDQVADLLNKYPNVHILITGHTCNIGTERENVRVGYARAQAVAKYLQSKGIDSQRMDIHSDGESNPQVSNNSPAHRSKNRRVTILCL